LLARRVTAAYVLPACVTACVLLVAGGGPVLASTARAGTGLAGTGLQAAPLSGSSSATLYQVTAGEWQTTVYLDTAALCAKTQPAGNKFTLVTGTPNQVTGAAAPSYPNGLACGAAAASPVTEVKLSFTPRPALSAVPQTAALVVTPPRADLGLTDPPLQIPLTVRRIVSPWQYVGIPAVCGGGLALLLVVLLLIIGVPAGRPVVASDVSASEQHASPRGQRPVTAEPPARDSVLARVSLGLLLFLLVMLGRYDPDRDDGGTGANLKALDAARPGVASPDLASPNLASPNLASTAAGGQRDGAAGRRRVHWGREFLRTPLFAGTAWSFGDSWATSVTPLTALAGAVLTASGAVAGLVPGVDLSRFALLMALVAGLTTLAPLLFSALNSLFPARNVAQPAPAGEVVAASLWVMLAASCLTVVAIGAETGFVGWVLGYDLLVASPSIRWIPPAVAGLTAVLFLGYGAHSILALVGQPSGIAKTTAKKHSFLI
jgi:hypothetical protein